MKTFVLLISFFFLANLTSIAQPNSSISGKVQARDQKEIAGVTATLYTLPDSVFTKLAITDKNGYYEFTGIKEGHYFIVISSVGYEKQVTATITVTAKGMIQVPLTTLVETAKGLSGVTVQSKRPFVETKIDKTIVNVEASPTSAGSSALEILEKSPGITITSEGAISLRGKQGVIVMMDGKPTYLSEADLADMLKNLPASALDQIEIMTNPSSKYDASGNSGIINIKTKKGKTAGFNGSVTIGASLTIYNVHGQTFNSPRSQSSFNFNYRNNKVNLFGSYNPNLFRGRNTQHVQRKNFDAATEDVIGYTDLATNSKLVNDNHTLKIGMDYFADKKNTLGIVVSGFAFNSHPITNVHSDIRKDDKILLSGLNTITSSNLLFKNLTSNLNWKHQFNSTQKELTVDMDYVAYSNNRNMLLETTPFDANRTEGNSSLLRGAMPSTITIASIKSDYVRTFQKGYFEAGIKSSYVKTDNLVNYEYWANSKWNADNRSNHFIYEENINAAYVNGNRQLKKWTLQGGLRVENTMATGNQLTSNTKFDRNKTSLFPSAFISYDVNKNNKLITSYSRRINRPSYQNLNPFIIFFDSLTFQKGNPYLKPQYSHTIELSHAFKNKYITTVAYTATTDVIAQVFKLSGLTFFNSFENVAKLDNFSLSVTLPLTVSKWWNINAFSNLFINRYRGIYNSAPIDMATTSFSVNLTNNFTLHKGLIAELSGFYTHSGITNQLAYLEPIYYMSLGLQKQVINGKGTVRLTIRDPFQWQLFEGSIRLKGVNTHFDNRPDTRFVTATFTYRFGKNTPQNQPRRKASGLQEEQSRVGQSGQ